jgi:hypothetical protein
MENGVRQPAEEKAGQNDRPSLTRNTTLLEFSTKKKVRIPDFFLTLFILFSIVYFLFSFI